MLTGMYLTSMLLDYIEGFTQNRITQYRVSGIAKVKYIHYL